MSSNCLDMPDLREHAQSGVSFLTDDALFDACGVRIAFTGRRGGVSEGPYASLNLGSHVGDDLPAVEANRQRVLDAIGAPQGHLITLDQVHGDTVLVVGSDSKAELDAVRTEAKAGADAIVVAAKDVAPLLCFADCVSVIAVAPSGHFAIAHAGWRGVLAGTARIAAEELTQLEVRAGYAQSQAQAARSLNVYIGPHIGGCCFQTGTDVREKFAGRFGTEALVADDRIDLARAIGQDLETIGIDPMRILDRGICTVCNAQSYFSYRASGGICGRHAAVAVRVR